MIDMQFENFESELRSLFFNNYVIRLLIVYSRR